jgi:hypothetical protein
LVKGRYPVANTSQVRFETSLRRNGLTSFVADKPWSFNGNEKSLDKRVDLSKKEILDRGYDVNDNFSSVDRVGL